MILHIGLPRTGTTTLQKFLFSDESLFAPSRNDRQEISRFHLLAGIGNALPDSAVDIEDAKLRLAQIKNSAGKNKTVLISQERITSLGNTLALQNIYARRLKLIEENAKVIITLRRQQSLIKSRFTQMKLRKHWAALGMYDPTRNISKKNKLKEGRKPLRALYVPNFIEWASMGLDNQFYCWFSILNYYDLYNSYAETLGPKNIKILFYEDLIKNKKEFADQLADFIGISADRIETAINKKANPSPTGLDLWRRIINNIKHPGEGINPGYALKCILGLEKTPDENNKYLLDLVRTHYGRQNRKLAQLLGEDLSARGYLMDSEQ